MAFRINVKPLKNIGFFMFKPRLDHDMLKQMAIQIPTRRILVIKTRGIGDSILLTGPLRLLKAKHPYFKIDVIVRAPGGELLEELPYVDHLICIKEPNGKLERLAYWARLIKRLRSKRYEMVLNFHSSVRTAFFSKLLRTGKVVSNHHDLKGKNWFSDVSVPGRGNVKNIIDRDLDLLRAIEMHVEVQNAYPEIRLTEEEKNWAKEQIKNSKQISGVDLGNSKLVFLGIAAGRKTKQWPPEKFLEMADRIIRKMKVKFVVVSTKSEKKLVDKYQHLLESMPELKNHIAFYSGFTLRNAASIISKCDVFVGNDSGLKHVAVSLGLPTLTLFGPELPREWHPYDVDRHPYEFINDLHCRTEEGKHWCSIDVCSKYDNQCMKLISVDRVLEKVWPLFEMNKHAH